MLKLAAAAEEPPLLSTPFRTKQTHDSGITTISPPNRKHFPEVDFQLVLRPRQPGISWDQFAQNDGVVQPYRLALDGYVEGASVIDTSRIIGNFDHHKDCDRLGTRATVGQVWLQIRAGFYRIFRDKYGPKVIAHINGHDEDDAFSTLLLAEPNLIIDDCKGILRRLVHDFDELDTTAGMAAVDLTDPNFQKIFWMTEPYRDSRNNLELINRKDPAEHQAIIDEIQSRIKHYLNHPYSCPRVEADTSYEVISDEDGWVMINEIGNQARMGALADGHTAIVSHRHMGSDAEGRDLHRYVFALTSADYHPDFPLERLADRLNDIEGCTTDKWGGNSNTVIGSPRGSFSRIPPDEMLRLIRENNAIRQQ